MATRHRVAQVGGVLGPPELLEARAAHAEGRLILEERRAEDGTTRGREPAAGRQARERGRET